MKDYLIAAIQYLRPNAEFSIENGDYSTIKWDVLDGNAPTVNEINDAIAEIKAAEVIEAEAKATAKIAAQEKLAALGLTTDDLKALGI